MATETITRTEKGISLARGPALILGTILEVAGLYFLYKQHGFPKFSNFPNGNAPVPGKVFLGIFGANGWTGLFTAAAGGLLLFGAAQHLLAKTMSLIVGAALLAAAVIAAISGNVLGLAAANNVTELGWGVCGIILLLNTGVRRRTRTVTEPADTTEAMVASRPAAVRREPATAVNEPATAVNEPATAVDEPATAVNQPATTQEEPIADRDAAIARDEPVAADEPLVSRRAVADEDPDATRAHPVSGED